MFYFEIFQIAYLPRKGGENGKGGNKVMALLVEISMQEIYNSPFNMTILLILLLTFPVIPLEIFPFV